MLTATSLAIQRLNTQRYIDLDPISLVLTPRTEQFVAGTRKRTSGTPRQAQTFHIIWGSFASGFVPTIAGGDTRRFDFVLVGNYDADVAIGDFWMVGNQDNEITFIDPPNHYEIKCGGVSHGGAPYA